LLTNLPPYLIPIAGVLVLGLILLVSHRLIMRLFGILLVPEERVAMVNKKYVVFGANKTLPEGRIIALNGEAGWQAETLPPGLYYGYWPWQYEIELEPFLVVKDGLLGVIQAHDGKPLDRAEGRILGRTVESNFFQDARSFIANGGERGPQLSILPPGTYRINTKLFGVTFDEATEIEQDTVGIVTVKDGRQLPPGAIAGPIIDGHMAFQNGQAFIDNGGYRGLQEQVILAGRYYLNSEFVNVETKPMTTVPIAHVGVVVAYVGKEGADISGAGFKHGNLVVRGERGVWADPLDPGKYPINPLTHKVENVPTANVVLNWATGKSESHNLDKNLSTITVRSSDGFTFNLDVSQIIHVPRSDAPKVIARFGSMQALVTQVLEPTIGNYFRNAAQISDAIDFLKQRQERQQAAKECITKALHEYNVEAVDTLIGDIVPPAELMKTLTDRKIADQQKVTFETQKLAQVTRKDLEQATAMANTQAQVVDAERQVQIQEFAATALIARTQGETRAKVIQAKADAESKTLNATADAAVTKLNGQANAEAVLSVGQAEADVIKLKIASMESGGYVAIEVSKNLANSKQALVPTIVSGESKGGLLETLLVQNIFQDKHAGPELSRI
jgi:uncharacterized membrane protein YqiK